MEQLLQQKTDQILELRGQLVSLQQDFDNLQHLVRMIPVDNVFDLRRLIILRKLSFAAHPSFKSISNICPRKQIEPMLCSKDMKQVNVTSTTSRPRMPNFETLFSPMRESKQNSFTPLVPGRTPISRGFEASGTS